MARKIVVMFTGNALGQATPFDGKYLVSYNPHTQAGVLACDTTPDRDKATRFDPAEFLRLYQTISNVQVVRPWDGRPNRPITGMTLLTEPAE